MPKRKGITILQKSQVVAFSFAAPKDLDHKEAILRTVANSMVWTMFRCRRWIVRQLWANESQAEVGSISRATGLFVDNINEDPDSVALMADITSSVNIGDVIVAHLSPEYPEPYIVELKDGAVNDRIVSLVEEFGAESEGLPAEVLQEIDTEIGRHGRRHFERVARQVRRARNFESIANHDVGNDPETGAPMQNTGPELTISTYDAELEAMMFAAAKNGSAFGCIDDCLWVGVYYSVPKHGTLLENFLREVSDHGVSTSFRVMSLHGVSTHPRFQPMFIRDLPAEYILDIMLGDVQVLVYMDWDAFFKLANQAGIHARWTTRKERNEITKDYYQETSFRQDGHIPVMERDGAQYMLMGGSFGRIVNEGLSPQTLLGMTYFSLRGWDVPQTNSSREDRQWFYMMDGSSTVSHW